MTSRVISSDADIDDLLSSLKYTFKESNDELKLPQPLTPEPSSPVPPPENNHAQELTPEVNFSPHTENNAQSLTPVINLNTSDQFDNDDDEIIQLKLHIQKLEAEMDKLKIDHECFTENAKLKITLLENQNAQSKEIVAEKMQTIRDMAEQYEHAQTMAHNYASQNLIEELENQNSTLLAENLAYDIQITEMKEQIYYRDLDTERLKSELAHQRALNQDVVDQISVLKIQSTEWQTDLSKEREDRAALASDRETILMQLKNEQQLNGALENHRSANKSKDFNSCTCM